MFVYLCAILILIFIFVCFFFFVGIFNLAALKNIGEKTSNLFERKKKEVGDLATEKASEAQSYAEEQAKKVGESIEQTKKEASEIVGGAGKMTIYLFANLSLSSSKSI